MHLRRLDPVHAADRPLELALQSAPVVDALREVGHAPGRAVEQLEAGRAALRKAAVLCEQNARTCEIGVRDLQARAARAQRVAHAVLIQHRRHGRDFVHGHVGHERHPRRRGRPAGQSDDGQQGQHTDRSNDRAAPPAVPIDQVA